MSLRAAAIPALVGATLASIAAVACKDPPSSGETKKRPDAAARSSASAAWETTIGPMPGKDLDAAGAVSAASAAPVDAGPSFADSIDAGAGACRRVRGPEKMPFV